MGLEKILEEIERLQDISGWDLQTVQGILAIIRKHLSGKDTNVPTNDGWILTEERLPEDGESVLCTNGEYVYLVEYDADLDAGFGDTDEIIAWQPLPEPYRPEKGE